MANLTFEKPDEPLLPIRRPKLRPWSAIGLSLAVFLIFQFLLCIPQLGESNRHRGGWYTLENGVATPWGVPFSKRIYRTETLEIWTVLPATEGMSLEFNGLDATGVTAYLNDVQIFRIGDHSQPTANLWNSMIVVPLPDSSSPTNRFKLTLSGNHVIAMNQSPKLEDSSRALRLQSLNTFLDNNLLLLAMGSSIVVGILLIGFSRQRGRKGYDGYLLGLSCFLVSIYALEFTFRVSTGSLAVHNILKRFMISCGYMATFTFLAGLDFQKNQRFTVSRWMIFPTAFTVILVAAAPNLGLLFSWLVPLNVVLVANLVVIVVIIFKDPNYRPLHLLAAGLVGMSLIQLTVALSMGLSIPVVIQYAVLFASIFFGLQFLLDFREVLQERENLRKSYNRDPLTDAYNRRALGDINLSFYSSAVFLDLDAFKYYNDRYGHDKGDEVLKSFVGLARSLLRHEDIVVRYGGDEFLILLKEADEKAVKGVVERIRRHFRNIVEDRKVDISYGISPIGPGGKLDIGELDMKMYAMKKLRKKSKTKV